MAVRNNILGVRTIASAAGDGLASRAVHIRVYPRPRNLAESREILRVLEGYGQVIMYKHLKVSITSYTQLLFKQYGKKRAHTQTNRVPKTNTRFAPRVNKV